MKLVGITKVEYVSKKDNTPKRGYILHCVSDGDNVISVGQIVYAPKGNLPYISDKLGNDIKLDVNKIGKNIQFIYNAYGSIENIIFS